MADYLVAKYGYVKRGFSVALKDEVARHFRKTLTIEAKQRYGYQLGAGSATLDECIHRLLWEDRTELTRALLQEYGTEVRRGDNPNYWTIRFICDFLENKGQRWVAQDVRFQNEFDLIKAWKGKLWWIDRPGVEPESEHASEHSLNQGSGWHEIVVNDGTKEALYERIDHAMSRLEITPAIPA